MSSKLSRRRFLGGAAAMIGLPFLPSLAPRTARSDNHERKKRFIAFYVPCGMHMAAWTPPDEGPNWTMTPILSPLASFRDRTLVLTGVDNKPARSDGGGDHASGTGGFLTCTHVHKTAGADIRASISLDQLVAPTLSAGLPFPSLELGTDGGAAVGDCDTGYSCAYARSIAWKNATTPLPKQTSPRGLFDRMFAGYDPEATAAELMRKQTYRKSVLDSALEQANDLSSKLGRSDRAKLDEYLTSVREVEARVDRPIQVCQPGARPSGDYNPNDDFAAISRAMIDLMAIAISCDQTRVITFMLGNAGSYHSHPQVGVTESHHELSHHMGSADNFEKLTRIDTWEVGELAYLMSKLDGIDDGHEETALDNSVIFFGSEIEDGDAHRHTNMPLLVTGGGSGLLATGVHRRVPGQTQGNLFLSLCNVLGVPQDTFGDDGTAPLPGIVVS